MHTLLQFFMTLLKEQPSLKNLEIYSSFDAVPVSSKSKKLFLVISPECIRLGEPFSDASGRIAPFTADFRFSLLAPMTTPNTTLLSFFESVLLPALHSQNCFLYEIQTDSPKSDYKLQKLVYSAVFRMKGLCFPDAQEVSI